MENVEFTYLRREDNQFADALAKISSLINMPNTMARLPLVIERRGEPIYVNTLEEVKDLEPWYVDIRNYLRSQQYPAGTTTKQQRALRLLASQYFMQGENLYKRNYGGPNLLCVTSHEAKDLMKQVHAGICGTHMNGRMLASKIIRLGYYWTTMERDCSQFVRACDTCQRHANAQHVPPSLPYTQASPWPFSTWGIDIIGKIAPPGQGNHQFILVAIDYFTKWVEAASYASLNAKQVARFIEINLICRYGVPHEIVSDNGTHFQGECADLIAKYQIRHHKSSPYRPQTNGAVEAANKSIKTIVAKMTQNYRDWPLKLHFALWGYRTSIRTPTGATPFSLVYGTEAVQPVELEIPSLRIVLESRLPEADWARARYDQLILCDEKRLAALHNIHAYQDRLERHFNSKVKPRNIKEGDLVLKALRKTILDPRGKFRPQWAGPYIVKKILSGGAVSLTDLNGDDFYSLTNLDQLKKYYV